MFNYEQSISALKANMINKKLKGNIKNKNENLIWGINFFGNLNNNSITKPTLLSQSEYPKNSQITNLFESQKSLLSINKNIEGTKQYLALLYKLTISIDRILCETSDEVRAFDSEISSNYEKEVVHPTIESSFTKLKIIDQNDSVLNSIINDSRISRNCVEITTLDSWNFYDWEESKPQCLNSSKNMHNLSVKRDSLKYFQNDAKQDWKLKKIMDDFKSKKNDTFDTLNISKFDELNS